MQKIKLVIKTMRWKAITLQVILIKRGQEQYKLKSLSKIYHF